ncbi:MAG: hypothetical protein JRJ87_22985, partial [Deltaproteobacteria bacterium]|nr:hypothetical protein [Deltaproteobacteria bacterium]
MRRMLGLLVVVLCVSGCGGSDHVTVELDPEYWLLLDNLPLSAGNGQALRAEGVWGRFLWEPDIPP